MKIGNTQMQLPPLTKVNKYLVIGTVSLFLFHSIMKLATGAYLSQFLSLSNGMFLSGHVYQIVTYPLMATGLFEVIFDCLILWFIGSELELLWGTKRYIKYISVSAILGGLLFIGISSLLGYSSYLSGPGGICYSLLVAYAILFPDRTLLLYLFPVKAKWFCLILTAILLYQGIFSVGGVGAWGHLGAMASGFGYLLFLARKSLKLPAFRTKKKNKAGLRIVKDEDNDGPKYWQ
jgi:membrane associated rhomboid family serine protease